MPIVIDISGPTTEEELAQAVAEATSEADAAAAGAAESEANALAYKNAAQDLFDNIDQETLEAVAQITTNYEQAVADFDNARDSGLSQIAAAKNDALTAVGAKVTEAQTARQGAEDAADAAESNRQDAVAARQGAESARQDAQTARSDAQGYKNSASNYANTASGAAQDASNYSQAASTARNDAVTAASDAATAQATAITKAGEAAASAASIALGQAGGVATLNTPKARLKARFNPPIVPDGRLRTYLLGQAFTQAAIPNAQSLDYLAENPETGRIAAVGFGGTGACLYYSDDAFTTVTAKATPDDTMSWRSICYLPWKKRWLLVATAGTGNRLAYSDDDLVTITQIASPDDATGWRGFVVVAEKELVYLFGASGGTHGLIHVSSDGQAWTACPVTGAPDISYRGACYIAYSETVVFVGINNTGGHCAARLTNFTTHAVTTVGSADDTLSWRDIVAAPWLGDGVAIAISETTTAGNKAMKTTDAGVTWSSMASPDDTKGYRGLCAIPELGLILALTRSTASIAYTKGTTWAAVSAPAGLNYECIIWSTVHRRAVGCATSASATNKYLLLSAPVGATPADLLLKAPTDGNGRVPWSATAIAGFATRAAFVTAAPTPDDGTIIAAAGFRYMRKAGSTAIADLHDWVPVGPDTPQHHGAVGDGVADDKTALTNCLNSGRPVDLGGLQYVYQCSGQVLWTQGADGFVRSDGATIRLAPAATIIQSFVKISATDYSLTIDGWLRIDANDRAYRAFEVNHAPTVMTSDFKCGLLEVMNAYRSGNAFAGGDGALFVAGYRDFDIDHLRVSNIHMARGTGSAGVQGVAGFSLYTSVQTYRPRNIRIGFVSIDGVKSDDRWYSADQDGIRIFTSDDSATDRMIWDTHPVIEAGRFRNCLGRAFKSQCETGVVQNIYVERDTGPLDRLSLTLTGSPAGNTSGVLSAAWFGNSTTTATIQWSDGTYSGDVTLTAGSTAVAWTGAAPAGATATVLIGGLALTLTGALTNAKSGTLTRAFGGLTSSKYCARFSDGSYRYGITLTNGSTAISWTDDGGGNVTASATLTEVGIPTVGVVEVDFQTGAGFLENFEGVYRNFAPTSLFGCSGTIEKNGIKRLSSGPTLRGVKAYFSGPSVPKMIVPIRLRKQKGKMYKATIEDVQIVTDRGVSVVDSLVNLSSSYSGHMSVSVKDCHGVFSNSLVDVLSSGGNTRMTTDIYAAANTNKLSVNAALTVAPTGTGGTLTGAWTGATGAYTVEFSEGSTRAATLTNGSTAMTWLGALDTTPGTSITLSGPLLVSTTPLVTASANVTLQQVNQIANIGFSVGADAVSSAGALDNISYACEVRVATADVVTVGGPADASSGIVTTECFNSTAMEQRFAEVLNPKRVWRRIRKSGGWDAWIMDPLIAYPSATPEGSLVGNLGELVTTTGGKLFVKGSNAGGNTGWVEK